MTFDTEQYICVRSVGHWWHSVKKMIWLHRHWKGQSTGDVTLDVWGHISEPDLSNTTFVKWPGPWYAIGPITCQTAERCRGVRKDLCPFSATAVLWLAQLCPFRVMVSDRCSWRHISAAPRCCLLGSNSLFVTFSPVISFTRHCEKTENVSSVYSSIFLKNWFYAYNLG